MAQKALIPEATLTYNHPAAAGMVTEYGCSRDWRLNKLWQGRFIEYIDPLKAIAPTGTIYPRDMSIAEWDATHNDAFGEWHADTYPAAKGIQFRDGAIYAAGATLTDYLGTLESVSEYLPPNLVLHTIRCMPPPGQGVIPQIVLELQGTYSGDEARIGLFLPKHSETYKTPFLHVYAGAWTTTINTFTQGTTVSEGPGTSSSAQGVLRESWVFETLEIWRDAAGVVYGEYASGRSFVRAHFLIRNTNDMSAWWHWSSDKFRCNAEGKWRINIAGAVTWVNAVPIVYGASAGYCWPPTALALPTMAGSTWNEEATPFGGIQTGVTDWTATVAAPTTTPPGASNRPKVVFTRTGAGGQYRRPVCWTTYEEHPAVVEIPAGLPEEQSTASASVLRSVEYETNNRWKGAQGAATCYPGVTSAPLPDWQENGIVELAVGLAPMDSASNDPALALGKIATAYILPDGMRRSRDGSLNSGDSQLSIAFGDYAAARLGQKAVVDFRQAGLRTVGSWAVSVALRIGIPAAAVTVDASVTDTIIPYHDMPSLPSFAPQDGDDWLSHITEVERACGIRVCFDKYGTGGMQVDTGPPKYEAGVSAISFTLDDSNVSLEDQIEQIEIDRDGGRFRNFLKVNYGPQEISLPYYYSQTLVARTAGIGDDWPEVVNADQSSSATDIAEEFLRERFRWDLGLRWSGPLRRHLRPDQFVLVNVGGIGVVDGTVLQIVTHKVSLSREDMTARSECLCTRVVVA